MYPQTMFFQIIKVVNKIISLNMILLIFIFSSCSTALKFSAVKYDASSINRLLDSTNMDRIILQFSSEEKKSFKVASYALTASYTAVDSTPYILENIKHPKTKSFKGKIVLGNISVPRTLIIAALTDDSTHLRITNFNYLLFTPDIDINTHQVFYYVSASVSKVVSPPKPPPPKPTQPCPPAICFNN